ncbi:MAG TPA: acyl-CoA dehydrogenase, partial [Sphingobacterium sp.]|nr:acyl-CoA dehydrogenase [Sphingobacterium sp.]
MIKKVRNILKLIKTIDFDQIDKISKKVNLSEVLGAVSKMDEKQLQMAMKMLTGSQKKKDPPPIDADFYDVEEKLSVEDRALQLKIRAFLESEVKPLVNKYWLRDEFPFEL